MVEGRQYHALVVLSDGRLLAIGGKGIAAQSHGRGSPHLSTVEIFDPAANEWVRTESMSLPRERPAAVTLADGRVVAAGGATLDRNSTNVTEIWDPETGLWTRAASMNQAREKMPVVLLGDGRVMVIGGADSEAQRSATAEIFDPDSGTWTEVAPMAEKRIWHTATTLADGRVLVTGGGNPDGPFLASAEIFDPETGVWTSARQHDRVALPAHRYTDGGWSRAGGRRPGQEAEL